jgi:hypothetical protein
MASTGTMLVLATGGMTFTNEWLQTHSINWRIPIATVLGAGIMEIISKVSSGAGTGLGLMILIAGATAPINGKSPVQEIASTLNTGKQSQSVQKVS